MPRLRKRGGGIGRQTYSQRHYRQHLLNANANENHNIPLIEGNTNYRNLQIDFENKLQNLQLNHCNNCSRVLLTDAIFNECQQCKKNSRKFTAANNMDPGIVPIELQDLTFVEQLLIARVQPVMRVYRIKSRGIPGQYAYKGNIINIGQNITEIINSLPRTPSTLSVVVVRREVLNEHRDFHVRRKKVLSALIFLKENNRYYADIEIDMEQISQLPIDGNIYESVQTVEIPDDLQLE